MTKTIIHIGANKTASTTLQRALFSQSDQLCYLGEDGENYANYQNALHALVTNDDLYYSQNEVEQILTETQKNRGNKTFIFSNEDISASPIPTLVATRLKQLMPDAEILIVLRNQLTALPSLYANHGAYLKNVPAPYFKRYVGFDDWMDYNFSFITKSYLPSFCYDQIIQLYQKFFDKVNILLFEDFVEHKEKFITQLATILNIDQAKTQQQLANQHERPRHTHRHHYYYRLRSFLPGLPLNPWFKNFLGKGKPFKPNLSEHWQNKIKKFYQSGNQWIEQEFKLDLKNHHYPL